MPASPRSSSASGSRSLVHAAFREDPDPNLEMDHELETIGTLHVMHACAAAKVRRLVVVSSTMLYGPWPDNPNFLTEAHPAARASGRPQRGKPAIEAESLLASWARGHPDTEVTVLRNCWILGPSYEDHVVTRYLARPVVPTLMGYDPLLQFVHEDDVRYACSRPRRASRTPVSSTWWGRA